MSQPLDDDTIGGRGTPILTRAQAKFIEDFAKELERMHSVVVAKNSDYTGTADPFGNLRRHGVYGILVRMDDKISRLLQLHAKSHGQVRDESFEDTARDLANYAILAILLRREINDADKKADLPNVGGDCYVHPNNVFIGPGVRQETERSGHNESGHPVRERDGVERGDGPSQSLGSSRSNSGPTRWSLERRGDEPRPHSSGEGGHSGQAGHPYPREGSD